MGDILLLVLAAFLMQWGTIVVFNRSAIDNSNRLLVYASILFVQMVYFLSLLIVTNVN